MSKLKLSRKLLCGILSLLTLPCFSEVKGQSLIRGVVKDTKGASLQGVTAVVKGTPTSAATIVAEKYALAGRLSFVLVVSKMGFETKEILVK